MNTPRQFEVKHFLWLCALCLPLLLLASCKWPRAKVYSYYDHRGVVFTHNGLSGVDWDKNAKTISWGKVLTAEEIAEVNRMREHAAR